MKRLFLLLTSLLLFSFAQSQHEFNGCNIVLTSPSSENLSWENDSIKFSFKPTLCNWIVTIQNKTDKNLTCIWDETLFITGNKSSSIAFDNTPAREKNSLKGTSIIASKTELQRRVFPLDNWTTGPVKPIFYRTEIKKLDLLIRLIFPVITDNQKRIYEFLFSVSK